MPRLKTPLGSLINLSREPLLRTTENLLMKLHSQQFVAGPEKVQPSPDWVHSPLTGWGTLSRSSALRTQIVRDRDGVEWTLLGLPLGCPAPAEQIAVANTRAIPEVYRNWTGRWVLFGNEECHMDAAGLLGCFFKGGRVSSSAGLLSGDESPISRQVGHGVGIDWYPLPTSRWSSVRRLLPSQILHASGEIYPRRLLNAVPYQRSYDAVLDELEHFLLTAVRAAAEHGSVSIPLTAGYDSRLILATACKAQIAVRTYTQGFANISHADRTLPKQIADAAGVPHTYIAPGPAKAEKYRIYDEHTGGHCVDRDREFVAKGEWDWTTSSDVILRGGCFEMGRCFYYDKLDRTWSVDHIVKAFREHDPTVRDALGQWIEWCTTHPELMDFRDRFYWEQRLGAWLSALEQSLDLLPSSRALIANSHRYYELVMELPEPVRRESQHHVDLVKRLAPHLQQFPYNPRDPLLHRVRRKLDSKFMGLRLRLLTFTLSAERARLARSQPPRT